MRIRNKRPHTLGLSYAGVKKGYAIKPGGLSPELPADRFYHAQLQRDWQRGYIDVLLTHSDVAELGPAVECYRPKGQVQVIDNEPVREKPMPTSPTKQSIIELLTATPEPVSVSNTVVEEAVVDTAVPEPAPEPINGGILEQIQDDGSQYVAEPEAEQAICASPICKTAFSNVKFDDRVGFSLCQYCRQQVSRRCARTTKKDKNADLTEVYAKCAEALKLNTLPVEATEQASAPAEVPVESFGYGVSLSDLNK
jgi:hypothetical protein